MKECASQNNKETTLKKKKLWYRTQTPTPDWKWGFWLVMTGSEGAGGFCWWYTVTGAPLEEKDEDGEAVAAFTTPFVMTSLILLTAPSEGEKQTISHTKKKQLEKKKKILYNIIKINEWILTVHQLSCLSLNMQIQRSVPEQSRPEQSCVSTDTINTTPTTSSLKTSS